MQMKSQPPGARCIAVDTVADDRPSHFRTMHAQLVSATGDRLEREPGQSRTSPQDLPCAGRWQARLVSLHPPASRFVALGKRDVDLSFCGLRSALDRKSTRLNSSHLGISYAVFCLKKKI